MSKHAIQKHIVREALRELGESFRTKELSALSIMLDGHPELASDSQYHARVGKFLSEQCTDIVEALDKTRRPDGALWRNLLGRPDAIAANSGVPSEPEITATDLGPQYAGDDKLTARMRLHQSWYRSEVLHLPYGTGPSAPSTALYGNMLRRQHALRGANFLAPEIHRIALQRLAQGVGLIEPFRLLHNMLSSQPMCFNLFGPLVNNTELATHLLRGAFSLPIKRVLAVKLEYAPEPRDQYLNDRTAFDAFIEYECPDGARAFLGIETKLTEPFSRKLCDSASYRRWMTGAHSPFRPDAEQRVANIAHNQLWRDHLLALAIRDHAGSPYRSGALMLVRHPEDRSCATISASYQQLLISGHDSFVDMPLDTLVRAWRAALAGDERGAWLQAFEQRYLSLQESEGAGR